MISYATILRKLLIIIKYLLILNINYLYVVYTQIISGIFFFDVDDELWHSAMVSES
jgi:hypothetical protein